ncbi:MAG: hypothetical protein Q4G25_13195 [Paracoccus sp. (in: a-proteobacteria)]|nr:hypothetical protein [Paracoccus sp. (in: a-proteobacteria)]
MTTTIIAKTNDRAELTVKKARFENDAETARMVAAIWENEGYRVCVHEED